MKPFEVQYTEWLDGTLTAHEQAEFEATLALKARLAGSPENSLDGIASAKADRSGARQLGSLLRNYTTAPELKNADFFNHQLMQQIEVEQRKSAPAPVRANASKRAEGPGPWPFWSFILGGASCLGIAVVLFFALVLPGIHPPTPEEAYFAQIVNTKPGDAGISAVAYHDYKENVTVLWLDGMDYVDPEPAQKQ